MTDPRVQTIRDNAAYLADGCDDMGDTPAITRTYEAVIAALDSLAAENERLREAVAVLRLYAQADALAELRLVLGDEQ